MSTARADLTRERRRRALELAEDYGGVVARQILTSAGIDRFVVAREVAAQRWQLHGRMTVAMHTGPLSVLAQQWRAIWEVSQSSAALDGTGALHAAGLKGFDVPAIVVSVPNVVTPSAVDGVVVRRVLRLPGEIVPVGIPRVRLPIATVRAAHWAATDRQAALLVAMAVQQRMVTTGQLRLAVDTCRTRGRIGVVRDVIAAVAGGAQTLGEIDFAKLCRERGLPEPDRQVIVRTPRGRIYLDVRWTSIGLVVEIDGSGHRVGLAVSEDNLRQNHVVIDGDVVLRIDLLGMAVRASEFMDQVCRAHAVLSARAGRTVVSQRAV